MPITGCARPRSATTALYDDAPEYRPDYTRGDDDTSDLREPLDYAEYDDPEFLDADYQADYDFIAAVYDALYTDERPIFTLADILALCERRPDIFALNQRYAGVNWYRHHLGELKTIESSHTRTVQEPT